VDVWYVAYGSNMSAARLGCYLGGGVPPGGKRAMEGCRDPSAPAGWVKFDIPWRLRFGGPSTVWNGGPAFVDVGTPGRTIGRAWLISHGQFEDILAQENRRPVGSVSVSTRELSAGGVVIPGSRYGRVVGLGAVDGKPAATFTYVERPQARAPDPAYVDLICVGLEEMGVPNAGAYIERITALRGADPYSE
jgi:hypothetical protein